MKVIDILKLIGKGTLVDIVVFFNNGVMLDNNIIGRFELDFEMVQKDYGEEGLQPNGDLDALLTPVVQDATVTNITSSEKGSVIIECLIKL